MTDYQDLLERADVNALMALPEDEVRRLKQAVLCVNYHASVKIALLQVQAGAAAINQLAALKKLTGDSLDE